MGAPQPAPNRLPPEVSPVFLGDTIKYFQLPMSQASPGSSRPGHCVAHWTSAPCVCSSPGIYRPGPHPSHTHSALHPHLAKICFSCRFFPWVTVGSHQPPNCSSQEPVSVLSPRKHSLNLYSVPCSELGPRGKDMPQCRLQILTGQWKPHKNKC